MIELIETLQRHITQSAAIYCILHFVQNAEKKRPNEKAEPSDWKFSSVLMPFETQQ